MNKTIQHIFAIAAVWLFNQTALAQQADSGQWKWQLPKQQTSMTLGEDTLSATPAFGSHENQHWWEIFGYQQLNALTALAISENQNIKIAESKVGIAQEQVKVSKANLYPSVSLNPSFARQEFSANRPMPFDVAAQRVSLNTYSVPLDLRYEVDIWGKAQSNVKASKYHLEASNASQESITLFIASEVAGNYIQLITLDTENKILERTLTTRKENLEIVKTRYSAGLANEIDLQRAKTELSSVAVQLKHNQLRRTEIELALATLAGQNASTFTLEQTGIKYLPPHINPVASGALASNRPDLKVREFSIRAYEEQVKNAKKKLYPSLYLDGSLGLLSGSFDNLFESESRNWLAGVTLSIPLFEGGRRKSQFSISKYQVQAVQEEYKLQELMANEEVERALSNLLRLNEQLVAQQEFLQAAQKAAELSGQRYLKGLVTYLEVVDAERIVLEAERLSAQLLGQQLLSTIRLIVATGGEKGILEFGN
ncbi:TolC family protein [Rapidithrix thailandica]|uniref:TolC family protein n=1 Tax=Rapidithrix thailandica TaxID=413964 RepID=A0AAW9SB26_9BACT